MNNNIDDLINEFIEECCPTFTLWEKLALEGNFKLIEKLRKVERGELGYGTIVVPEKGFSESDKTHNTVLNWLEERNINILNPGLEKARLKYALKGEM